jgi:hypothetical protein
MEPLLKDNDKTMFYKYLNKANIYFEYGSGGSTYQALIRENIKQIYSIESDYIWYAKLKELLKESKKINYIYNEMDVQPNTFGHPGKNSTIEQKIQYSDQIIKVDEDEKKKIDLILIDGRFRVACCMKCFDVINNDCYIAFDDFLDRSYYHVILEYYDIIEKTDDNRMVILKKKQNITSIDKSLIEKYELIQA